MRFLLIIIYLVLFQIANAQSVDTSKFYLGISVGHLVKTKKVLNTETLINIDNNDDVSGNITLGYHFFKKFGVLTEINFAEYSLNNDTYTSYISLKYPSYYLLAANKSKYKQYNLKLGMSYLLRLKRFELIPAVLVARYFFFEPVEANLIIKETGSNLTREFNYIPISKKNLINFSGAIISKYTFKSGLGFHFIFDYCFSKPLIGYLVYEKAFLYTSSINNFEEKVNLTSMNFLFGMHCNFSLKKRK